MNWRLALKAVRPFAFPTSIFPITIGSFFYWGTLSNTIDWPLFILTLLCGVSIHAGTNLNNDYWDYLKGVDSSQSFGSSKMLPLKLLLPKQVKNLVVLLFVIALGLGILLGILSDYRVSLIALLGILSGYYYTAPPIQFKYRGLGPILVFIMKGPLMILVGGMVQNSQWSTDLLALSFPIGCLVSLILQANDIRDMYWDNCGGITTMALYLGKELAVTVFSFMGSMVFIAIPILVWLEMLSWIALLTWMFLPSFLALNVRINKGTAEQLLNIDIQMTKLYSSVCLIILLSAII